MDLSSNLLIAAVIGIADETPGPTTVGRLI
jgi:hypothetical protein